MKANLLIQDDAELRRDIRRIIEQHVKAVAESDLKKLLADAVSKYQLDKKYISELIDKEITRQVAKGLSDNCSFSSPNYAKVTKLVEKVAKERVDELTPNLQNAINRYVALKVDAGLTAEIQELVDKRVDRRMNEVFKQIVKGG